MSLLCFIGFSASTGIQIEMVMSVFFREVAVKTKTALTTSYRRAIFAISGQDYLITGFLQVLKKPHGK